MPNRILITGGSSLLGLNWAFARAKTDTLIVGINKRNIKVDFAEYIKLKLANPEKLCRQLESLKPNLIVNTIAITDIKYCEENFKEALLVNCQYAENIAIAAKSLDVKLVHISTDHLFDGIKPKVSEKEPCSPLNKYGETKFLAESRVLDKNPKALIVRTNFFCWGPRYRSSFSDWIISMLNRKERFTLYDDVFFSPLYAGEVIEACHALVTKDKTGIYNVSSSSRISKYDFGLKICEIMDLNKNLISRGFYGENNSILRPLDMSLDNSKLLKRYQRR